MAENCQLIHVCCILTLWFCRCFSWMFSTGSCRWDRQYHVTYIVTNDNILLTQTDTTELDDIQW